MKGQRLQGFAVPLSMAVALLFWAGSMIAMALRLDCADNLYDFLRNAALGVTFVAGVTSAGAAFSLVIRREVVLGRDALAGVCRRTVIAPFGGSLGALLLGAVGSAFALRAWYAGQVSDISRLWATSLLPVGIGFALMGSLVGNLAGSVTLDARDLGHMTRVNFVLLISSTAFWMFLMWVVFQMLRDRIAGLIP